MIKQINNFGKYLDQPLLVGKFSKAVPTTLFGLSGMYMLNETRKAPKEKKKETALNTCLILGISSIAALLAPRFASKVIGRPYEKTDTSAIIKSNKVLVNKFLSANTVSENLQGILNKARKKVLNIKDISILNQTISKTPHGKSFMNEFIPEPQNITAGEIVKDMTRLSIIGAMPVIGGILGGITADTLTDKPHWKDKLPNKIKEGVYQYLANIFLCNVGAAGALGIMESLKIKSKSMRALGMIAGIISTGVIGGSSIANFISKKLINPIFDKKESTAKLYEERKPEVLDICLHTDDIATIAVMSGFKWIEPSLPILYTISGYRSGIGYRNGKQNKLQDNLVIQNNLNNKIDNNSKSGHD